MKFLAILRDSLREAIDAKVFYVMIGLSALLIAVAFSCTFRPKPGGDLLMRMASVPLIVDLTDLKLSENPEPEQIIGQFARRFQGGIYEVTQVQPVGGSPDLPTSTFVVKLKAHQLNPLTNHEEHIRKNFGQLDRWRIAEVIEIRRLDAPVAGLIRNPFAGEFELQARVTSAGRRLWPYDFSLFFGALPVIASNQASQSGPGGPPGLMAGIPLAAQLFVLENYVVGGFGAWVAILVSIVITAFFIPNMLRKGTIDLLLVKPISRVTLLLYKFVGGLLFIFLNTTVAITGVWVALGLRSGIWAPAFLLTIFIITFFFAILYAVSAFFGVLTRSPIVAILLTCLIWGILFFVGVSHHFIEAERKRDSLARLRQATPVLMGLIGVQASPQGQGPLLAAALLTHGRSGHRHFGRGDFEDAPMDFSDANPLTRPVLFDNGFTRTIAALHYVLPRTKDLDGLTTQLLLSDLVFSNAVGTGKLAAAPISWGESLTVSGLFIALMLGLACWRFATRDY